MSLPYPSMDFTAFDVLTAAQMDQIVANIEALAAGTGFNTSASIPSINLSNACKFSAYRSAALTGASGANTILFDTEEYDTSNNYNPANGRFTATVAGVHHFSSALNSAVNNGGWTSLGLLKNGVAAKIGNGFVGYVPGSAQTMAAAVNADILLAVNDYVQVSWTTNGVPAYVGASGVYFQGHFVSK